MIIHTSLLISYIRKICNILTAPACSNVFAKSATLGRVRINKHLQLGPSIDKTNYILMFELIDRRGKLINYIIN